MLSRSTPFWLLGLLLLVSFLAFDSRCHAQPSTEPFQWRSGLTEISDGWLTHDGEDPVCAQRVCDDRAWQTVDLEELGPAQQGWHCYRKRIHLGPEHARARLLIEAGEGAYELYVNGQRTPGSSLRSALLVKRPTEHVFEVSSTDGDIQLAIRSHIPPSYFEYHLPLFITVTVGDPIGIEYERAALESQRLYDFVPSFGINVLVALAGLGALSLFALQRTQREYLFLGLYLLVVSTNALLVGQQDGVLPVSANLLVADPLIYVAAVILIEFTFSFVRRRLTWPWRVYELLLLLPILLVSLCWFGRFSEDTYLLIEAILTAPMIVLPPAVLFIWYRRGNHEAGWLIFPTLLPSAFGALFDVGSSALHFGWHSLEFLVNPISIGPISIRPSDLGSLLFLIAVGCVVCFRYARVSRQQARSIAEFEAAREVQQRLVPLTVPPIPGYTVQAAYLPALEVGGDFYQVLYQPGGNTLLVLGDVSGKGLKAAMTGTLAIGALRSLSTEDLRPSDVLRRLNRAILETQDGGFVTCICTRISPNGHLLIANAGHLSPYRNGIEITLDSGLPLGIADFIEYADTAVQLAPGDMLLFLSDGVVEAQNASGELFGFERTAAISTASASRVAQYAQEFGQVDDITVLTLTAELAGAVKS